MASPVPPGLWPVLARARGDEAFRQDLHLLRAGAAAATGFAIGAPERAWLTSATAAELRAGIEQAPPGADPFRSPPTERPVCGGMRVDVPPARPRLACPTCGAETSGRTSSGRCGARLR